MPDHDHDICIVGLKCYDLLVGAAVPRYLGGIEKQLVSLAQGLVESGKRVAFITYDHGQEDEIVCDGITIYKSYAPTAGLPFLRFVHPRMTLHWRAMRKADAAVYLQMGAGSETGVTALGCRKSGKFVYLVASDADCAKKLSMLPRLRERLLYKYGLYAAVDVVAQSRRQQVMLNNSFSIHAKLLPLPCSWAIPDADYVAKVFLGQSVNILWVGRIVEIKRLEWLLDAAEQCPEYHFDVVGTPNADSVYFDGIRKRIESMKNVTMHGRVSDAALSDLYARAGLLCCTSEVEGFPTTFLEAWNLGLPVLTTFDPDGIVEKNAVGCVVDTREQLIVTMRKLFSDPAEWCRLSVNARTFFCRHYTASALMPQYIDLLF